MDCEAYKILVFIPEEFSDKLMERINEVIEPFHPGYDMCFSSVKVNSTWRPLEGSKPFIGTIGVIEHAEELRIEFIVREKELRDVIRTIREVHPYEEPAIDVIPCLDWKRIVQ